MPVDLLFLVFFIANHVYAIETECSDCKPYTECPLVTYNQLSKLDQTSLTSAVCGLTTTGVPPVVIPKICCSQLDAIELHPNSKLLPKECGDINGDRIIGGEIAGLYEFPWMALISYRRVNRDDFGCGGSIINSRYILTAAHCVRYQTIAKVRIGEYDIRFKTDCQGEGKSAVCESHIQDINVESVIYPDIRGQLNDIALIRLENPIDFSHDNAAPICLPLSKNLRDSSISGVEAAVAGWGLTENKTDFSILMKVKLPVRSDDSCSKSRGITIENLQTNKEFCAGALKKDSCRGDSGGPLMIESIYRGVYRHVQYGVVSRGPHDCGSEDLPGIYTDVRKHMLWILDNMKE